MQKAEQGDILWIQGISWPVLVVSNNRFMIESNKYDAKSEEDLRDINRRIVQLGEQYKKPVCATCDAHFLDPEDAVYRQVLQAGCGLLIRSGQCDRESLYWYRRAAVPDLQETVSDAVPKVITHEPMMPAAGGKSRLRCSYAFLPEHINEDGFPDQPCCEIRTRAGGMCPQDCIIKLPAAHKILTSLLWRNRMESPREKSPGFLCSERGGTEEPSLRSVDGRGASGSSLIVTRVSPAMRESLPG